MNEQSRPRRSSGFSLVELMIAMTLGVVLLGGAITIFSANVRSAQFAQAMASLQAGARYAMQSMAADVRSAGFRGCASPGTSILSVSIATAATTLFREDVLGARLVKSTGWMPAPPGGYKPLKSSGTTTPAGVPVDATHALVVQYAAAPGNALSASMGSPTAAIELTGTNPALQPGGFGIVSDCESADVFKIETLGGTDAARTVQPMGVLNKRYLRRPGYPESTRVFPLVGAVYYVGDTGRRNARNDPIHALYLQSLPFDVTENPPVELLEGVDQLQLRFGIVDEDGQTRFKAPGDSGHDMSDVRIMKIGLLMSSVEPLLDTATTRVFHLAGQSVGPKGTTPAAGTPTYPSDKRLRVPFNTTIRLRNRHP